jgi:predicted DsbA family dithiol-disulfide isomerase
VPSLRYRDRSIQKMGSPERADKAMAHLTRLGVAEGINFKFGGKIGQTRDSHRLVELAKEKMGDGGVKMQEVLFEMYFEEEKDIADVEVLVEAGKRAGFEEDVVRKWIDTDGGGEIVDREVEAASLRTLKGVPRFTVNGDLFEGALDPSEWYEIFVKIKRLDGGCPARKWGLWI